MPFKSQAQRIKFQKLVEEGKMSQATYDEWERASRGKPLPERVTPKPRGRTVGTVKKAKVIK